MNVSVIGCGYVGLVSGVCLADKGHRVVCVDVDQTKVDRINNAVAPIHEDGLPELLKKHSGKLLTATTDLRKAVMESDLTLIAVGTPFDGKHIDLTYIKKSAEQIGQILKEKKSYHVVVVKSTVVPGTTDDVVGPIVAKYSGKKLGQDFGIGMNPEFLSEGVAINDFMFPDRIVLGGNDEKALGKLKELYACFPDVPVVTCNCKTAEMIKYVSNALLATAISFSNEIANLCTELGGIDALEVMRANHINHYLTVKLPDGSRKKAPLTSFFEAGCGYGGSCLPKDVSALVAHGKDRGLSMNLLETVNQINRAQPAQVVKLVQSKLGSLKGKKVAVLGLAFKPDTDDMRESPAFPVIDQLHREGAGVKAYDPVAGEVARKTISNLKFEISNSLASAIDGVDAIVIITRWDEFKKLPELIKGKSTPVIDGRRMLDPKSVINYSGIGL